MPVTVFYIPEGHLGHIIRAQTKTEYYQYVIVFPVYLTLQK